MRNAFVYNAHWRRSQMQMRCMISFEYWFSGKIINFSLSESKPVKLFTPKKLNPNAVGSLSMAIGGQLISSDGTCKSASKTAANTFIISFCIKNEVKWKENLFIFLSSSWKTFRFSPFSIDCDPNQLADFDMLADDKTYRASRFVDICFRKKWKEIHGRALTHAQKVYSKWKAVTYLFIITFSV